MRTLVIVKWVQIIFLSILTFNVDAAEYVPKPCTAATCGNWSYSGKSRLNQNFIDNKMDVYQFNQKEVFNWESFNIGENYTVEFHQPNASSIALNRIHDGNPSYIAGKLFSNGQVYIINPNGILFKGTAQVDVGGLIASSLNVNLDADDPNYLASEFVKKDIITLINDGNEAGEYFAFVSRDISKDEEGNVQAIEMEEFSSEDYRFGKAKRDENGDLIALLDENNKPIRIKVEVEEQAVIRTKAGGDVMLFAPVVKNSGNIETEEGQVVLASAEDKIWLTPITNDSTNSLRGYVVEVSTGGLTENIGNIIVQKDNVSLIGMAVNQNGLVQATSAIRSGGSIRLIARQGAKRVSNLTGSSQDVNLIGVGKNSLASSPIAYGVDTGEQGDEGKVQFGANSITEVIIDPKETGLMPDAQLLIAPKVFAYGRNIELDENAKISAKGGVVDLKAFTSANQLNTDGTDFFPANSTISMAEGSIIDVSGTEDTELDANRKIIEVSLTTEFLKDAPKQRNDSSTIKNEKIYVEVDKGTPLGDINSALEGVEKPLSEQLSRGGKVNINTDGAFIQGVDSTIDISGGKVSYKEGFVETSQLVTTTGEVVDVGEADPNYDYSGTVEKLVNYDTKWGVKREWKLNGFKSGSSFRESFVEGKDAGEIEITASYLQLDGDIDGSTEVGEFQYDLDNKPVGGTLNVGISDSVSNVVRVIDNVNAAEERSALQDINETIEYWTENFDKANFALSLDDQYFLRNEIENFNAEVQRFEIGAGANLELLDNSRFSVETTNGVLVKGNVVAPGGEFSFSSSANAETGGESYIFMEDGATIDVSGKWVNRFENINENDLSQFDTIDGGSITLSASHGLGIPKIKINKNAKLIADGGALVEYSGDLEKGRGGDVSILLDGDQAAITNEVILDIEGDVRSIFSSKSGESGGALTIRANGFVLVGDEEYESNFDNLIFGQSNVSSNLSSVDLPGNENLEDSMSEKLTWIPEGLFTDSGFSSFGFESFSKSILVDNSFSKPLNQKSFDFESNSSLTESEYRLLQSDSSIGSNFDFIVPETWERRPLDLQFVVNSEENAANKTIKFLQEEGASITLDPQSKVNIVSYESPIYIDGVIDSRAGKIKSELLALSSVYRPDLGIFIGQEALLDASAVVVPNYSEVGLKQGDLLDGGTISLLAEEGFVFLESGSVLDVSSTKDTFDTPASYLKLKRQEHAADAGDVLLTAAESIIFADANHIKANGNVDLGGAGGVLSINLDPNNRIDKSFQVDPTIEDLSHSRNSRTIVLANEDSVSTNITRGSDLPEGMTGIAYVNEKLIEKSGVQDLSINAYDINAFEDVAPQVNSKVKLDEVNLNVMGDLVLTTNQLDVMGSNVELSAAYIKLGVQDLQEQFENDFSMFAAGTGLKKGLNDLEFSANLVDLSGDIAINGAETITLRAQEGIRLLGVREGSDLQVRSGVTNIESQLFDGKLFTTGDLVFDTPTLFPSSFTAFTIDNSFVDGSIDFINSFSPSTDAPLSALGEITIRTNDFALGSRIDAPFGQISIEAENITADNGAVINTSMGEIPVIFGTNSNGLEWEYTISNDETLLFDVINNIRVSSENTGENRRTFEESRVELSADSISIAENTLIAIDGGGELLSWDFISGLGGSKDILSKSVNPNGFAIIPGFDGISPFDHLISNDSNVNYGEKVYLSGIEGVFEGGYFTVLPARYALLPNAYFVSPTKTNPYSFVKNRVDLDESSVVSGHLIDSSGSIQNTFNQQFRVFNNTQVNERAEYNLLDASSYFINKAIEREVSIPNLPKNGGHLVVEAKSNLDFQGTVLGEPAGDSWRPAKVDLTGEDIRIVNSTDDIQNENVTYLLSETLKNMSSNSVLVGGKRSNSEDGEILELSAQSLTISEGVELEGIDWIFVAKDRLEANGNVEISAYSDRPQNLFSNEQLKIDEYTINIDEEDVISTDAAILRVSSFAQTNLVSSSTRNDSGEIYLSQGSLLKSNGSVYVDATKSLQIASKIELDNASLALASDNWILSANGLTNSEQDHASFSFDQIENSKAKEIIFSARESIMLAEDTDSDVDYFVLDTPNLFAQGNVTLNTSGSLELRNSHEESLISNSLDKAELNLSSNSVVFGGGKVDLVNIDQFTVEADELIQFSSGSMISEASSVTFNTPVIQSETLADFEFGFENADFSINESQVGSNEYDASNQFGAKLKIKSKSLSIDSVFDLPSAFVNLETENDIVLLGGGSIDVAGTARNFSGNWVATPGGSINLVTQSGDIILSEGSKIDVSAESEFDSNAKEVSYQNAGSIALYASSGLIDIAGEVQGQSNESAKGGRILVSSSEFSEIDTLISSIERGFFTESVSLITSSGGIDIGNHLTLTANDINLVASGSGGIKVSGVLDASGMEGGSISLYSNTDINVQGISDSAPAKLLAKATGNNSEGGQISLFAQGINISDALFDVTGTKINEIPDFDENGVAIRDSFGNYVYSERNSGEIYIASSDLFSSDGVEVNGMFKGVDYVFVDAVINHMLQADIGADQIAIDNEYIYSVLDDSKNLIDANKDSFAGNWNSKASYVIAPNVIITSEKDLVLEGSGDSLDEAVNLVGYRFGGKAAPGTFSLRSVGEMSIETDIQDGVDYFDVETLLQGVGEVSTITSSAYELTFDDSWNINLVSGVDLASANPYAISGSDQGINFGEDVTVRTGTGDISVYSGGDLNLGQGSRIFTTGNRSPLKYMDDYFWYERVVFSNERIFRFGFELFSNPLPSFNQETISTYGGDLSIKAEGDIIGWEESQFVNNWLYEVEQSNIYTSADVINETFTPAISRVSIANFDHNLGALGGGDIVVESKGRIESLSAAIPSVDAYFGELKLAENDKPDLLLVRSRGAYADNLATTTLNEGSISLSAIDDIEGGSYFVGQGDINLMSLGSVTNSGDENVGSVFAMMDTQTNVFAYDDVNIGLVYNPTLIFGIRDGKALRGATDNRRVSYSENASVNLFSLSGDIVPGTNLVEIKEHWATPREVDTIIVNDRANVSDFLDYRPANFSAKAFLGSIFFDEGFLFDSKVDPSLVLFADKDISVTQQLLENPSKKISLTQIDLIDDLIPQKVDGLFQGEWGDTGFGRKLILRANDNSINSNNERYRNNRRSQVDKEAYSASKLVTRIGDINGENRLSLILKENVDISAGRDFTKMNKVYVQNQNSADVSTIFARRDVVYDTPRTSLGKLDIGRQLNELQIQGPGKIVVGAGRNVNLGASKGINSVASAWNSRLSEEGSDIVVLAGIGESLSVTEFLENYIVSENSDVTSFSDEQINGFVTLLEVIEDFNDSGALQRSIYEFISQDEVNRELTTSLLENTSLAKYSELKDQTRESQLDYILNLSSAQFVQVLSDVTNEELRSAILALERDSLFSFISKNKKAALNAYSKFTSNQKLILSTTILSSELNMAGTLAVSEDNDEIYQRGYNAINTLFQDTEDLDYLNDPESTKLLGDVSLITSRIITKENGDIDILIPGGNLNTGVSGDLFSGDSSTSNIDSDPFGVLSIKEGSINIFTRDDVLVNESRIFALDGGDIQIWSSYGDIDAGRGARTAIAIPPPKIELLTREENGILVTQYSVDFGASVAGSGIRASVFSEENVPGDVYLFAPKGVINASDAGIGGEGGFVGGALDIIGNDITFAGPTQGIPTSDVGGLSASIAGLSSIGSSATGSVDENVDSVGSKQAGLADQALSWLEVFVIGFGDDEESDDDEDK